VIAAKERIRRLKPVLSDGKPAAVFLAGIAAVVAVCTLLTDNVQDGARYAGGLLEMLGILLVAREIRGKQRQFGLPGFRQRILEWCGRVMDAALGRPQVYTAKFEGAGYATLGGRAKMRVGRSPSRPVEERLASIEAELERVLEVIEEQDDRLGRQIASTQRAVDAERIQRVDGQAALKRTVDELAVGGLAFEAVGLVWLLLGLVCATFPDALERIYLWAAA
jgi:hypothetical protein